MSRNVVRSFFWTIGLSATTLAVLGTDTDAQTIRGRLLDAETGQPIDLGLVILVTEAGDSITSTVTNRSGLFSLTSPELGSFLLQASAWGYRETSEGVFELGEGGAMTVEFRIHPEPLPIDEILVGVDRPVFDHKLVRQGFVRRFQRGLGHFITPYDIENSLARTTEALLENIPGVTVRSAGYLGDVVKMWTPTMAQCDPIVFVDGIRVGYRQPLISISTVVPLATIEAVEVYRRPAEIPVEYGVTQPPGANRSTFSGGGSCGILVFWTKQGLAAGQTPAFGTPRSADRETGGAIAGPLPRVDEQGPPPSPGARIRMGIDLAAAAPGLVSPLVGTFQGLREEDLIVNDARSGRPVAVPLRVVQELQVERTRGFGHAVKRGVIAGSIFAVGSWASLRFICGRGCARRDYARLPALAIGAFAGLLVAGQGPGTHWVRAPLPEPRGGEAAAPALIRHRPMLSR